MRPAPSSPTAPYEEVGCALCGSSASRLRFRDDPYTVRVCEECGLTYVTPRLKGAARLERVYGEDYWRSIAASERGYADYRKDAELYRRTFRQRWERIAPLLPAAGRALDVGCAAGYFLDVLVEEGWDAVGIEPSESIARTARERHGSERVFAEAFEQARFAPDSFDLVSFWDVLEHLADPVAALQRARALLRPGGLIVLETQNIGSLFARLSGRRWHHFKHAEHLVHFDPSTLRGALARAGLAIVEMSTRGAGKYVRGDFLVERSARLGRFFPRLLAPLLGGDWTLYVNLGDELIVAARARPGGHDSGPGRFEEAGR